MPNLRNRLELRIDAETSRRRGTEPKAWEMQDIDPLPFWNKGRAILVGDAAHAMTPMQGQGGNLAIEDGESFRLLQHANSESVPAILKEIDRLRRPRASRILSSTRAAAEEQQSPDAWQASMDYISSYNGILELQKQHENA